MQDMFHIDVSHEVKMSVLSSHNLSNHKALNHVDLSSLNIHINKGRHSDLKLFRYYCVSCTKYESQKGNFVTF